MGSRLYVGNLDYAVTEAELQQLFETVGAVKSVNLIMDRMTGRSRGFAFVEMADDHLAKEAIGHLNGRMLGQRALKVDEAHTERTSSRGGAGGARRERW